MGPVPALTAAHLHVVAAYEGAAPLRVVDVRTEEENEPLSEPLVELDPLQVATATAPSYTLTLVGLPDVDPFFESASFSFEVDDPRRYDCAATPPAVAAEPPVPAIDYLVRDYASFRRLMLDRLSLLMPEWRQVSPIDWPVAVVEALAAAADQVSYFQDAVATEAYLGTARRRTSVRRHARLLDYRMHDGCTARVWVAFEVAESVSLTWRTCLLTRLEGSPPIRIAPDSLWLRDSASGTEAFETLHPVKLTTARNRLSFYAWDARELWLDEGATAATLVAPADATLQPGDVLIFEEVLGPSTGQEADADPEHRHAVRLTRVRDAPDPLNGTELLEIEWHASDALLFPLCVRAGGQEVAVARGNVVLAAYGRTVKDEAPEPETVPDSGRYRPRLRRRGLAHSVPYDDNLARSRPAAGALVQDPRAAMPEIYLQETKADADLPNAARGETWTPRRDLLASDRFARELVVEMTGDGAARLRFGDGAHGRRPSPGTRFAAYYRLGNGTAGNVGRDAVAHLVTADESVDAVTSVRNPLAARGGLDPEPIERVRLDAPQAFRTPARCVTADDYAAVARRHPEVARAAAVRRWVGSWQVIRVAVERRGGRTVDVAFREELRNFLEPFRLAGADLQVRDPRWVPVEVLLTVHVHPDHFPSTVLQALLEAFSNVELPGGRRGFFHRSKHDFGEPVYLSRALQAAMAVPGVAWVETTPGKGQKERIRFQRVGQPPRDELAEGRIDVGPLDIARLDNDPDAPENGSVTFLLEGGR